MGAEKRLPLLSEMMVVGGKETMMGLASEIRNLPRRRRFRHLLKRFIHEHDSPRRLSLAIAVGVFIGTLPFFGFHMWIGLVVALVARLNKLAVFLGTQISMPWIAPMLIAASLQLGELILHHRLLEMDLSLFHPGDLPSLFVPWLIGSVALGILLGILSFCLSMSLLLKWKRFRTQPCSAVEDPKNAVPT